MKIGRNMSGGATIRNWCRHLGTIGPAWLGRLFGLTVLATTVLAGNAVQQSARAQNNVESIPFGGDLIDLIPALYGGDGIFLQPPTVGFSHAPHFIADSLLKFNDLSLSVRELNFPRINTQTSAQFQYDPVLDEYVREDTALIGSLFAEDADTIGEGVLQLGAIYAFQDFTQLEGESLDEIVVDLNHVDLGGNGPGLPCIGGAPPNCYAFERDVVRLDMDVEIQEEQLFLFTAYGITDRWDVGLIVPIVRVRMTVSSFATVVPDSSAQFFPFVLHQFGPDSDPQGSALRATRSGLGDIFVRTKYWVVQSTDDQPIDFSVGLDVRAPTGDVDNLRGLPRLGARPILIASSKYDLWGGQIRPHINLGYEFNSGINQEHELGYALGAAYGFRILDDEGSLAFSADLLGSNVVVGRDGPGDDRYDLSLGVSAEVAKGVNLFYTAVVPLNNEGLRPDVLHSGGVTLVF